ncbi:sugar porter family MFS transporter [Nesterenkonia alba]|uniref:sugar porter family MFS transporter n=1 Tax=Nesterenkonia alba TaxID=515814 RepID=UPI0003B48F8D|nr:sugar porter family MFS transporter [Nesterenkonia alba]
MTTQTRSGEPAVGAVAWVVLVAAFGGFLFGFDTAVINGAVGPIAEEFDLGAGMSGFSVSSALLGCVIGAFTGGKISDMLGRQKAMLVAAGLFFLSAIGTGLVFGVTDLIAWRVIGGIGVGMASVIAPAYIAEVSPAAWRGRLGSLFQLAIVVGIFMAAFSNWIFAEVAGGASEELWFGLEAWRWMFLSEAAPALIYGLLALSIPESPRYLVSRGRNDDAEKVLTEVVGIQGKDDLAQKIEDIRATINLEARQKLKDLFLGGKLMPIVWVGIGLAVFQQFVGINVIFYYSTSLWTAVGIAEEQAMLVQVITTSVNIIATIVGILIVDKVGRRIPLAVGSAVMAVGLGTMAIAFSQAELVEVVNEFGEIETEPNLVGMWGPIALVAANVFVVGFGATWGPFMWLMLGEMFPNRVRAVALGVCSAFNWLANFAISSSFPSMAELSLVFSYGFYAISALISLFFVLKFVPETKGREIEEMQETAHRRS